MVCLLGPGRDNAMQSILSRWAVLIRNGANAALGLPTGSARDQAIADIAQQWAEKDVRAALAWTEKLGDGGGQQVAWSKGPVRLGRKTKPDAPRLTLPRSRWCGKGTSQWEQSRRELVSSAPQTALIGSKNFLTKPPAKTRLSHSSRSGRDRPEKRRLSLPWIK
jgi:hypothetical protein